MKGGSLGAVNERRGKNNRPAPKGIPEGIPVSDHKRSQTITDRRPWLVSDHKARGERLSAQYLVPVPRKRLGPRSEARGPRGKT